MRTIIIFLISLFTILPVYAAVDISMEGSVYTEISSRSGDLLQAGNRIKLFSEIYVPGEKELKLRAWSLNQKNDELNRFDTPFSLDFQNKVDWVEINLKGTFFPFGPYLDMSIGNIEVDYSPYTIMLKDQAFNEYVDDTRNYYGVIIKGLRLGNSQSSFFALTGFDEDPWKNMFGGQLSYQKGNFLVKANYLDYACRRQNAEEVILERMRRQSRIKLEREYENTFEIELEKELFAGTFGCQLVAQQVKYYKRIVLDVMPFEESSLLKDLSFKTPLNDNVELIIGYRDYPNEFDPILRDRTPEFDSRTGLFLGHNPVDRYKDKRGTYATLGATANALKFRASISDYRNHTSKSSRFKETELQSSVRIRGWDIDMYQCFNNVSTQLDTNEHDYEREKFIRTSISYPRNLGGLILAPGIEYWEQDNELNTSKLLSLFIRSELQKMFFFEAGLRQGILNYKGGTYCALEYVAPNGLTIKHYYSTAPLAQNDGRIYYDPDYRMLRPANLTHISVSVNF